MLFVFLLVAGTISLSSAEIDLGAAKSFGILGRLSVANTGPSVVNGDLGTGGNTITGFPPGIVTGSILNGSVTDNAFLDAASAYTTISLFTPAMDLTGTDLGGLNLSPGAYKFSSSAQLTGTLTLNGTGSSNETWYFQIGSSLTTDTSAAVVISGGASACNVYWQVGSSATIGVGTSFAGTILALSSVTLNTGVALNGRAFGLFASDTLDSDAVFVPNCAVSSSSTSGISSSSTSAPLNPIGTSPSSTSITNVNVLSGSSTTVPNNQEPTSPPDSLSATATSELVPSGPAIPSTLQAPSSTPNSVVATEVAVVTGSTVTSLSMSSQLPISSQSPDTTLDSSLSSSSKPSSNLQSFSSMTSWALSSPTSISSVISNISTQASSSTTNFQVSTRTQESTSSLLSNFTTHTSTSSASFPTSTQTSSLSLTLMSNTSTQINIPTSSASLNLTAPALFAQNDRIHEAIITVLITEIATLTSCPHKATCTGQTTSWTGTEGPLPCSAFTTCSCVLPGGTQTVTRCSQSTLCTGQTIQWIDNDGPTACPKGVTCNWVLPSANSGVFPTADKVVLASLTAGQSVARQSSTSMVTADTCKLGKGYEGVVAFAAFLVFCLL